MRILLDVDDVLTDFIGAAKEIINEILGAPWAPPTDAWDMFARLPYEVREAVSKVIDRPGWCSALPPYQDAQDAVKQLQQLGEVFAVTSPRTSGREWTFERSNWLKRHFDIPSDNVVYIKQKRICRGDILIDDCPENIITWGHENRGGYGILWSTPYNQWFQGALRAHGWEDILTLVRSRTKMK